MFLLEFVILLPHPMVYFEGATFEIIETADEVYMKHDVNNFLSQLSLFRIFILIRSLVNLTMYATPRAARLCNHNGIGHTFLYCIKCILRERPLHAISFVFIIMWITLGYSLKLSEGTLHRTNPSLSPNGF